MESMKNLGTNEKMGALEHAHQLFDVWNQKLQLRDAEKVADLYTTLVSFLPTMSNELVTDKAGVVNYFQHFLQKFPDGNITESVAQYVGDNNILHSGKYTFTVGPDDARTEVLARFTYMWANVNGVWKISHHHSSLLPA